MSLHPPTTLQRSHSTPNSLFSQFSFPTKSPSTTSSLEQHSSFAQHSTTSYRFGGSSGQNGMQGGQGEGQYGERVHVDYSSTHRTGGGGPQGGMEGVEEGWERRGSVHRVAGEYYYSDNQDYGNSTSLISFPPPPHSYVHSHSHSSPSTTTTNGGGLVNFPPRFHHLIPKYDGEWNPVQWAPPEIARHDFESSLVAPMMERSNAGGGHHRDHLANSTTRGMASEEYSDVRTRISRPLESPDRSTAPALRFTDSGPPPSTTTNHPSFLSLLSTTIPYLPLPPNQARSLLPPTQSYSRPSTSSSGGFSEEEGQQPNSNLFSFQPPEIQHYPPSFEQRMEENRTRGAGGGGGGGGGHHRNKSSGNYINPANVSPEIHLKSHFAALQAEGMSSEGEGEGEVEGMRFPIYPTPPLISSGRFEGEHHGNGRPIIGIDTTMRQRYTPPTTTNLPFFPSTSHHSAHPNSPHSSPIAPPSLRSTESLMISPQRERGGDETVSSGLGYTFGRGVSRAEEEFYHSSSSSASRRERADGEGGRKKRREEDDDDYSESDSPNPHPLPASLPPLTTQRSASRSVDKPTRSSNATLKSKSSSFTTRGIYHPKPASMLHPELQSSSSTTLHKLNDGPALFPGTKSTGLPTDEEFARMITKKSRGRRPRAGDGGRAAAAEGARKRKADAEGDEGEFDGEVGGEEEGEGEYVEKEEAFNGYTKNGKPKKVFVLPFFPSLSSPSIFYFED